MTATYHVGDTRQVLATLPDASVDLIISSPPFLALRSYLPADHPDKQFEIGSESTPGAFLDVLLDVVEACARVLAPHGSLCFELGDTYSGKWASENTPLDVRFNDSVRGDKISETRRTTHAHHNKMRDNGPQMGWPLDKSLCLIPQTFAFALAYGRNPHTGRTTDPWRIRNVVHWWRPNPPVGALGDKWRPATSDITVACKSARRYWDDIATRTSPDAVLDTRQRNTNGPKVGADPSVVLAANYDERIPSHVAGAPLQDTWRIPTAPYKGSHYATYPPALVEPLIKAMCPPRVCTTCGDPARRIVETDRSFDNVTESSGRSKVAKQGGALGAIYEVTRETVGWSDCGHNTWRRGVVCDPFAGTGTTLQVAEGHGHDSIGIDLDPRNAHLATERLGMFLEVA